MIMTDFEKAAIMDYFTSNYIEGQYPIGLWNHYEIKG